MTALSLFDLASLAAQNQQPQSTSAHEATARVMMVAESMVASAIEQFEKVEKLDVAFASPTEEPSDGIFNTEAAVVLRSMYEDCTRVTECVLGRIERLESQGRKVTGADTLRIWYRRIMGMLSVPLEDIAKSLEDVRHGRVISGADVRNELHARLHR
jgi:hypothetical protein